MMALRARKHGGSVSLHGIQLGFSAIHVYLVRTNGLRTHSGRIDSIALQSKPSVRFVSCAKRSTQPASFARQHVLAIRTAIGSPPCLQTGEGGHVGPATHRGTTDPVGMPAAGIASVGPDSAAGWHIEMGAVEMTERFRAILCIEIANNLIIALFTNATTKPPFVAPWQIENVLDALRHGGIELQAGMARRNSSAIARC
jgi:hypothetical protein